MNILLFFVFPFATIIYSVVLQKLIKCPILVALTIFASFLIVTFTAFDESFLIYTILYTSLSYLVSILTKIVKKILMRLLSAQDDSDDSNNCIDDNDTTCECNNRSGYPQNCYFQQRKYWK